MSKKPLAATVLAASLLALSACSLIDSDSDNEPSAQEEISTTHSPTISTSPYRKPTSTTTTTTTPTTTTQAQPIAVAPVTISWKFNTNRYEAYWTPTEITRGGTCRYGDSTLRIPDDHELLQIWATYEAPQADASSGVGKSPYGLTLSSIKDAEGFTLNGEDYDTVSCDSPDGYYSLDSAVAPGTKIRLYGAYSIPKATASITLKDGDHKTTFDYTF